MENVGIGIYKVVQSINDGFAPRCAARQDVGAPIARPRAHIRNSTKVVNVDGPAKSRKYIWTKYSSTAAERIQSGFMGVLSSLLERYYGLQLPWPC